MGSVFHIRPVIIDYTYIYYSLLTCFPLRKTILVNPFFSFYSIFSHILCCFFTYSFTSAFAQHRNQLEICMTALQAILVVPTLIFSQCRHALLVVPPRRFQVGIGVFTKGCPQKKSNYCLLTQLRIIHILILQNTQIMFLQYEELMT